MRILPSQSSGMKRKVGSASVVLDGEREPVRSRDAAPILPLPAPPSGSAPS